jgi:NAD(P)-dependent dehydrogenase (short-subunit alcohol dehydrogenase family)
MAVVKQTIRKPLKGRVALVAGATRGAGRGVARALAEAGATVYCTGRSVKGKPSPYKRPETIDETAAMIKAAGGKAIALRVDHTNENAVKALFRRILRAHTRLDIVVDSVAGEDPLMGLYGYLWQADLTKADAIYRQGLTSRIITAKHAALAMMPAKRGLIVEVTENDMMGGGGNPMAQTVKMAQKVLPLFWAAELASHGITVLAITPGFLRSESMLQGLGVTEDNWRDAGKKDPNFLESESPLSDARSRRWRPTRRSTNAAACSSAPGRLDGSIGSPTTTAAAPTGAATRSTSPLCRRSGSTSSAEAPISSLRG